MTEVKLTPGDGNYYMAMAFHYGVVGVCLIPVLLLLIIAIINPFWFRDDFFAWAEKFVYKLARWRDYRKYAIYLGTDPKMWHALKDSHENN